MYSITTHYFSESLIIAVEYLILQASSIINSIKPCHKSLTTRRTNKRFVIREILYEDDGAKKTCCNFNFRTH